MRLEDLTPEQKEKALACKTPEELLALAKDEGYELSDEEAFGPNGDYDTTDVFNFEEGGSYEIGSGYSGDFKSDDAHGFTGN